MNQGVVKFYNSMKSFGFITADNGEEIFFHKSNVKDSGFRSALVEGDKVRFDLRREEKGKRAYNIVRI